MFSKSLGDINFFTPIWIDKMSRTEHTITRIVKRYKFTIIYDGRSTVTINHYPVTVKEWENVINNGEETLKDGPNTVTVTYKNNNIYFDNNPLYDDSITTIYNFGPTSTTPTSTKPEPEGK